MIHAEKATGSTKLKKHYWSPAIRNAGVLCRYWKLRMQSNQDKYDRSDCIQRLQAMAQQHDPTYLFPLLHDELTAAQLEMKWKMAKQELKTLQKHARELRYRSYTEILEAYECDIYNPESARRAKIIKTTIRTEKCRDMYRQIRSAANSTSEQTRGINSVLIPDDDQTHPSPTDTP
jgi:hypothetical protein